MRNLQKNSMTTPPLPPIPPIHFVLPLFFRKLFQTTSISFSFEKIYHMYIFQSFPYHMSPLEHSSYILANQVKPRLDQILTQLGNPVKASFQVPQHNSQLSFTIHHSEYYVFSNNGSYIVIDSVKTVILLGRFSFPSI